MGGFYGPSVFTFHKKELGLRTSTAGALQQELGESGEENGAVPPFLPSPDVFLGPKSVE